VRTGTAAAELSWQRMFTAAMAIMLPDVVGPGVARPRVGGFAKRARDGAAQLARTDRMAAAISSARRVPTSRSQVTSVGPSSVASTVARRSSGIGPKRAS